MSFFSLFGVEIPIAHATLKVSEDSRGGIVQSVNGQRFDSRKHRKKKISFEMIEMSRSQADSMLQLLEGRFFKIPFSNGLGGDGGLNPMPNGYSNMTNINVDAEYAAMSKIEGAGATLFNNATVHYDFRETNLTIIYYYHDGTTQRRYFYRAKDGNTWDEMQPTSGGNSWTMQTLSARRAARYQQASGTRYIADCIVFKDVIDDDVLGLILSSKKRISEYRGVVFAGDALGGDEVECECTCTITSVAVDSFKLSCEAIEI